MPKLTVEQTSDLDRLFGAFRVEVSVRFEASPERVWDLVTDISRIGEFSLEAVGAEWVHGATGPAVGACFVGQNKVGDLEWSRVCMVVASERPRMFAYVVGDRFDGSRTGRWSYELTSDGDGTIVRQCFEHEATGRSGVRLRAERDPARAGEIVSARTKYLEENMAITLEAMRAVLETPTRVVPEVSA